MKLKGRTQRWAPEDGSGAVHGVSREPQLVHGVHVAHEEFGRGPVRGLGGPEVEVRVLARLEEERAVARLDLRDLVHHPRVVLGVEFDLLLVVRELVSRKRQGGDSEKKSDHCSRWCACRYSTRPHATRRNTNTNQAAKVLKKVAGTSSYAAGAEDKHALLVHILAVE